MYYSFLLLLAIITVGYAAILPSSSVSGGDIGRVVARQSKSASDSCLKTNLIQSASALTGQEKGTDGIKAGQAKSST